jgi:predicted phosphoribosyltransferase
MRFTDRADAGRALATQLTHYAARQDVIVLGLPRGGVPVAAEVAAALAVPLDLFLVRKLGVPGHPELAMGAIAEGDVEITSDDLIKELCITAQQLAAVVEQERAELERRATHYRGTRPRPGLAGLTVILVDDGLATGSTMQAAAVALRHLDPARIIVAAPVAAPATVTRLARYADEIVTVLAPDNFRAVGLWYDAFDQTTDEEVEELMSRPGPRSPVPGPDPEPRAS